MGVCMRWPGIGELTEGPSGASNTGSDTGSDTGGELEERGSFGNLVSPSPSSSFQYFHYLICEQINKSSQKGSDTSSDTGRELEERGSSDKSPIIFISAFSLYKMWRYQQILTQGLWIDTLGKPEEQEGIGNSLTPLILPRSWKLILTHIPVPALGNTSHWPVVNLTKSSSPTQKVLQLHRRVWGT